MASSNPTLGAFEKYSRDEAVVAGDVMTVEGTTVKTGILTLLLAVAFGLTWGALRTSEPGMQYGVAMGASIVGLILALIIIFVQKTAPMLAPLYAIVEGVCLAGLSLPLEAKYNGIALQAASLTILTLGGMMVLYRTGIIKVNSTFKAVVIGATFAIAGFYLLGLILSLFGIQIPGMFGNSMLSIGISVVIVGIAALNLALDFDFIESHAGQLPKYYEWYGAFSLMVTLVWLYVEILRLLSKVRSR